MNDWMWGFSPAEPIHFSLHVAEYVGGPLDGCKSNELHPSTNVARYELGADGDFHYVAPLVSEPVVRSARLTPLWDVDPVRILISSFMLGASIGALALILQSPLP